MNTHVVAIVPAYDENKRINAVLTALSRTPELTEIIVVDDGSKDPIIISKNDFPKVSVIRHSKNKGKAEAMITGVNASSAPYILFCDADLTGLQPEQISALITPVINGDCRMTIGIRGNPEQRMVRFVALNSGERCLLRTDWDALPSFFKRGYRIETGLNMFIKKRGTILPLNFDYRQTLKESKYGFWRGSILRWKMNFEIVVAWMYLALRSF